MRQYNVEATRTARANNSIQYRRNRAAMLDRQAAEKRELAAKHEREASDLWKQFCIENAKVVV